MDGRINTDAKYQAMAAFLSARAAAIGISSASEIQAALSRIGISVHWNMVRRWLDGDARPQDDRLEGLLDVLGVVQEYEREHARRLAYMPPAIVAPTNREQA